MCFDLSVYDIFGTLAAGGKVVIARKEQVQNPEELKQIVNKHRITFWDSVPSTMNYLVNALEESSHDRSLYLQEGFTAGLYERGLDSGELTRRLKDLFPQHPGNLLGRGDGRHGLVDLLPD